MSKPPSQTVGLPSQKKQTIVELGSAVLSDDLQAALTDKPDELPTILLIQIASTLNRLEAQGIH